METLYLVGLGGAAALGAAINAVAGGGTFLVFPLLILSGLGAVQANIMATIALWPGSVASSVAFKSERAHLEMKRLVPLIAISIIGSALGTWLLLSTPEATFSYLVPYLLLGATLLFTFGKKLIRHSREGGSLALNRNWIPACAGMTGIAIYGGYFGAGIGILMLAMLQMLGMRQIHEMNAVKTVLGSTINAVAFAIFVFSPLVVWDVAIVMIFGAILGGYVGARLSLRVSPQKVRLIISVLGFAMSGYFFLYGV